MRSSPADAGQALAAAVTGNEPAHARHVLIVENDSLTCDVIEFVIQSTVPDCKIQLAVCLRDATAMLDSQTFDLVIADLGLPDSRGVETAAALRTRSPCDIMLYSAALNDPHVMNEARQAGFEHCVPKSADNRGAVRQCIRQLLDTVH